MSLCDWSKEWGQATYNERVTVRSHVHLYGGYHESGQGVVRDPRKYETTIDGDVSPAGSAVTMYAGHLMSTLDGFTVTGGVATHGGGVYCYPSESPTIANNTITGNSATNYGGGIYCPSSSYAQILGNAVLSNASTGVGLSKGGGGICCITSNATVANNIVSGNSSGSVGGGVLISGTGTPYITNNTIVGNSCSAGAGVYVASGTPVVANNIVAFNTGSPGNGIQYVTGTPTLVHNDVYGNSGSGYINCTGDEHSIALDPLFVGSGDYHLQGDSPCIDTGDDTKVTAGWLDIDGEPRTIPPGGTVDIGADEVLWIADIDTDCNNNGNISDDDAAEESIPGKCLRVNNDDDNNNLSPDIEDTGTVSQENDLARVDLSYEPAAHMAGATFTLQATGTHIAVWSSSTKGTEITLPVDYSTATLPGTVWVEGAATGETFLELVVKSGSTEISRDRIRFTVEEVPPKTLFVRKGGSDSCSGLSWSEAKLTIGSALSLVDSDGYQVWVAEGTYVENLDMPGFDVKLYGAFPSDGGGWSSRSRTDNETILDGSGGTGSVVDASDAAFDGQIDGFTITGGSGYAGGGVYCVGACTISNNTITENVLECPASPYIVYGAGIYCGGEAVIRNNTVKLNTAAENAILYGGGIYCTAGSAPIIKNNFVIHNAASAGKGGGAYLAADGNGTCRAALFNNTFARNTATVEGGGLFIQECQGLSYIDAQMDNCIVAYNSAGIGGGFGGLELASTSHAWWSNLAYGNTLLDQTSDDFGGWVSSPVYVADPAFANNQSDFHLTENSLYCIDSGTVADNSNWPNPPNQFVRDGDTDIDGEQRQYDYPLIGSSHVDIGADEVCCPTTPVVTDDGDTTTITGSLHASWQCLSPGSPITGYSYAIGTSQTVPEGTPDVRDWTAESGTQVTATGLNLTVGQTYYFYVKAQNGVLAWSAAGVSDGITVVGENQVAPPVFSPKDAYHEGCLLVTLTCATPGATIRYLVDPPLSPYPDPGSSSGDPTYDPAGGVLLGGADQSTQRIFAKAYKDGMTASPTVCRTYYRDDDYFGGGAAVEYTCWKWASELPAPPAPSVQRIRVADMHLTGDEQTPGYYTKVTWAPAAGANHTYSVQRTLDGQSVPLTAQNVGGEWFVEDNLNFLTASPVPYQYSVALGSWSEPEPPELDEHSPSNCSNYPNCTIYNRKRWSAGSARSINVTPVVLPASANQAVDSRCDLRYCSTPCVPLDFQFQDLSYRGGLFAGYAVAPEDHSDVGRSFMKFDFTGASRDPASTDRLWTANLHAYYNRSLKGTTATQIGCHPVDDDSWVDSGDQCVKWSTAPAVTPANHCGAVTVGPDDSTPLPKSYWCYWNGMFGAVSDGLYGDSVMSAALASTDETVEGWAYFVKNEYNPALGPRLVYAFGNYTDGTIPVFPAGIWLSSNTVKGTHCVTGTLILNGPAPPGGKSVCVYVTCQDCNGHCYAYVPSPVLVPAGEASAQFTISTAAVTSNTLVTISAGIPPMDAWASLTITP